MGRTLKWKSMKELEEALLAFRISRRRGRTVASWLRAIRQATGTPVEEVREKLGVTKWEVFRLEQSEAEGRIQISSLRKAAQGLDCELVYALVPREGSLEEMRARQLGAQRNKQMDRDHERALRLKPWLKWTGAHELLIDAMRKALQRYEGVRMRPMKKPPDDWDVQEALEKAAEAVRMAKGIEMVMRPSAHPPRRTLAGDPEAIHPSEQRSLAGDPEAMRGEEDGMEDGQEGE